MSVGELVIGKREGGIAFDRLIEQTDSLEQSLLQGCIVNSSCDECFGPYVQMVSSEISRWFLLDCRFFARRDFGFKLRDYLPGHLALDCKHVGDIAIVAFGPDLAVRPGIDQLRANAHPTACTLHC